MCLLCSLLLYYIQSALGRVYAVFESLVVWGTGQLSSAGARKFHLGAIAQGASVPQWGPGAKPR